MQYYCAHCNHLEEVESFTGEDDMVCDRCGRTLTALKKAANSVSPAPRRLALIILLGVTGYLLVVLWRWGGNQPAWFGQWWEVLGPLIWTIEIGLKIGFSIVVVSLALLIGAKLAASRHRVPENTTGVKQASQIRPARNWLVITSSSGMALGTTIIVFIVVGVIWFVWKIVFTIPFLGM